MPHKHQTEIITHIWDQITTNQERNQQPCKMTLILLLPASRHDKHDTTHIKTKHTTHPAPGDISTTTHHSSRGTAAPMSSLPLPPHFCSAMIVVAPLLRCAIQSAAAAALDLAALSCSPPSITFQPVFHPPPAHQHQYSWLDCFMLLVVVFLPRVIRHHSPLLQKKKKRKPQLSTT